MSYDSALVANSHVEQTDSPSLTTPPNTQLIHVSVAHCRTFSFASETHISINNLARLAYTLLKRSNAFHPV